MNKFIRESDKLINKIKFAEIKPRPKFYFIIKNVIFWASFVLFAVFGAVAFSIILYALISGDLGLMVTSPKVGFKFLLVSIPIIWILFLILFTYLSAIGVKYTDKGYKYTILRIAIINIVLSVVLGTLMFYGDVAKKFDLILARGIPVYEGIETFKVNRWSSPEFGLLSGKIIKKIDDEQVMLEDFYEKTWTIDLSGVTIMGGVLTDVGSDIKIIGDADFNNNIFFAKRIGPWGRGGAGGERKRRFWSIND